jgi:hypothetical protein
MADVAKNLSQASKDEVYAIATYVASLSPPQPDNMTAAITDNVGKTQPPDVVAIYTQPAQRSRTR